MNLIKLFNYLIYFFFLEYRRFLNVIFFKHFFFKFNFLKYYVLNFNKLYYLNFFVMFKRQNSLLRKKYNYFLNLNPAFFKRSFNIRRSKKWGFLKNHLENKVSIDRYLFTRVDFFLKNHKYNSLLDSNYQTLNMRKKYKKMIFYNRDILKNFLFSRNSIRSYRLTRQVLIKSKLRVIDLLLNFEYSLIYMLLNTNLVKSFQDLKFLMSTKCIFVNRTFNSNLFHVLQVGDIIEFSLIRRYFFYIKKFKKKLKKITFKLRNRIWYKFKFSGNLEKNLFLKKAFQTNLTIKRYISRNIEIDYGLLTIVIIMKNFDLKLLNFNLKTMLTLYLFKLYNWGWK